MTSSPHFSVIMPLYNKAPYVRKAIESVLGQTYCDWELVVVDDGSSDNSIGIALQTIECYANCRLIHQENAGVSMARNNGVAASLGKYLCFLDADDWWEPTFLAEMDQLIKEFPDAGIYGTNYTIVNETKHKTRIAPIGIPDGFERGYINYCQAYSKNMGMPLTSSSVCIPRSVYLEMGGFPTVIRLGEDFILWIHIALKYKVAFLNKPLSNYNQDISLSERAVGRLHAPEHHMLWNLQDLESIEIANPDYKKLIDKLRICDLRPYHLSKAYHSDTKRELLKVDWLKQAYCVRFFFASPLFIARIIEWLKKGMSCLLCSCKKIASVLSETSWIIGFVEGGLESVVEPNKELQVKWVSHGYKDRWFADPFILNETEESIIILAEEYQFSDKKGRIVQLSVNKKDMTVAERKLLLEDDTHFSFPAIYRKDDRVFVYPENHKKGQLFLYEYTKNGLSKVSELCNEPLTDAIITDLFGERRMYSTQMPDPNGDIINVFRFNAGVGRFIYTTSCYLPPRSARMAGDFFVYKGRIFKPSQDCSNTYGGAIRLFETADGLSFSYYSTIHSPHSKFRLGIHTINSFNGRVVIDVKGYRYPIWGTVLSFAHQIKKKLLS